MRFSSRPMRLLVDVLVLAGAALPSFLLVFALTAYTLGRLTVVAALVAGALLGLAERGVVRRAGFSGRFWRRLSIIGWFAGSVVALAVGWVVLRFVPRPVAVGEVLAVAAPVLLAGAAVRGLALASSLPTVVRLRTAALLTGLVVVAGETIVLGARLSLPWHAVAAAALFYAVGFAALGPRASGAADARQGTMPKA